jgi:coenzyme PQQ synthesis protein D (PqqD)
VARYVRSDGVEAAPMLEETILYSPSAKRFCVLNPTAALVWEKLAEPVTFEQLAVSVRQQFEAEGADVEGDLRTALQQFEALDMLRTIGDA